MTRINSRPATKADIETFFGKAPPFSVRARVLERGGEVVGVAGYYMAGGFAIVFSDIKGKIPSMTIWREAVALLESLKVPAICVAQEGSEKLLERLGWKHASSSENGEVYTWLH